MNLIKTTTKIQKAFLAIFLSIMAYPASAQKDEWKEIVQNNLQIEKDIQSLIADTLVLHQAIVKFDAEQLRLNAQINSIAKKYEELKADADKKTINIIQQKVDSLYEVVKELQDRKKELSAINSQRETTLSDLNRSMSSMGVYSVLRDEQMFSLYQKTLLKPYSVITIENLSEIESKLNSFTMRPDFIEFRSHLSSCKKNKVLYDAAEALLKVKYDANEIDKTRDKLYELLDIKESDFSKGVVKLSDAQYSEIDTLDIKLSRYGDGIDVLQGIVKAVNDSGVREQYQEDKNACVEAMQSIVISGAFEDIEKRHRYFDMIPYLKDLYQKYWDELQADPFACPTEIETKIMQLKNE